MKLEAGICVFDMIRTSRESDEFGSWSCLFELDEYCLVLNLVKNPSMYEFEPLASYEMSLVRCRV